MISDIQFKKFKELMKNHVGEEKFSAMSEQYLLESAIKLITLMKAIYRHITKEEYEKYSKN